MLERIGNIVRTVRERENCSSSDLAERSGVPASVLTALEQGESGITTTQLDDVAQALSLDSTALLNGQEVLRPVPSIFLRHTPVQDFDARDGDVLDEALEQGRALVNLRALLGKPKLGLQSGTWLQRPAASDQQTAPAQDGYRLAREVRRWLEDVETPLGDLGVLIEERFGIAVLVRTLESDRLAAASVRAGNCAAIVLPHQELLRTRNPLLTRVHIAHELCHVLFDPSQGGLHIVVDVSADKKNHAAEQRARAFAAEFLLPLDGLKKSLGPPRNVNDPSKALDLIVRARHQFGTPHEIATNHLCNLHFIDLELRELLLQTSTRFADSLPTTTLPAADQPSQFVARYVQEAHNEESLTDGEARSLLGLDRLSPLPWDKVEP